MANPVTGLLGGMAMSNMSTAGSMAMSINQIGNNFLLTGMKQAEENSRGR